MNNNCQKKDSYICSHLIKRGIMLAAAILSGTVFAQQSYTFTNCGATGSVGPTQTQVNNTYSTTNLNGLVGVIGGIQTWTAPYSGNFRIEARGAQGGGSGGPGATMAGDFTLTAGEVIRILVGQVGENGGTGPHGGGGGSFVVRAPYTSTANILVIAGGGSGAGNYSFTNGTVSTTGVTGGVAGGINGNGGGGGTRGAGGGGFLTNGGPCSVNTAYASPGSAFVNGGLGGPRTNHTCGFTASGGFGGGSSHGGNCINNGGAGGGFSGGGGSSNTTSGGGGSFNAGTNQLNSSGTNSGNGRVVITELCSISLSVASANTPVNSICSGGSVTLTTNAVSGYSWSTGNTTSSVVVDSPTITTTYSLSGTSSLACTALAFITVTVSGSVPSITVAQTSNSVCLGQSAMFTAGGALTYTWSNGLTNGVAFQPSATAVYTVSGENGCGITTATAAVAVAPLPVNVFGPTSPVCAGAISTLVASSSATSFTWQPTNATGATLITTPSSTTIYTVTASNGTCVGVNDFTVTTIPLPTITAIASASTICDGESVVLTASGGLNYNWTPGNLSGPSITVTPNSPILYSVSGFNAQGCDASATAVIIVYPAPTLVPGTNDPLICNGGSATLNVTGATNYTWSNGSNASSIVVNPAQSTVYSVIGLNNTSTCTATSTISVDVFTPLVTISGNTAICSGATTTLVASGANSYTWSNGIQFSNITVSPTVNTVYTLSAITVTNSLNCPSTNTVEVSIKPNPMVTAVADRTVICRNETVTVMAGGANSYTWNNGSTGASVSITSSLVTTLLLNVTGLGSNGCSGSVGTTILVNGCSGISESVAGGSGIQIFPNPANHEVNISFDSEIDLQIMNETGQLVKLVKLDAGNNYSLNVSGLANGLYFVTGQKGDKTVHEKLVIHH